MNFKRLKIYTSKYKICFYHEFQTLIVKKLRMSNYLYKSSEKCVIMISMIYSFTNIKNRLRCS